MIIKTKAKQLCASQVGIRILDLCWPLLFWDARLPSLCNRRGLSDCGEVFQNFLHLDFAKRIWIWLADGMLICILEKLAGLTIEFESV